MKRGGMILLMLIALVVVLATFPLRLALGLAGAETAGLTARGVTGSIWSGRIVDAVWRGADLGSVDAGLNPLALLGGDVRVDVRRDDQLRGPLTGGLMLAGDQGVADVSGALSLGASLAGVPLDTLRLTGVTVRFDGDGRCVAAGGQAQLTLALPVPGLDLANGLSGPLACRDGRAEATLASQSGMERLRLGIDGKGRWRAQLGVASGSDPALAGLLRAAGFVDDGDQLMLVRAGQL